MRVQNSLNNIIFGLSGQAISCVMGFIVRTIFIKTLGIEYLGVDGLFSNILTLLSLANLGFDTAIIYSLYRPLSENDKEQIAGLMNLYQKAYKIIGLVVLLIGLSLMPFLSYLMNGKTNINNINYIYLLFLFNSVLSYFFVYKQSIIIADQRSYIISKINSAGTIISNLTQIIFLLVTRNYIIVLAAQILFRVLQNIYISNKADKIYPFLKGKKNLKLSKAEKKGFFLVLYSLVLYRISGVVINGTDNIVISKFVGLISVGMYSNYLLVTATLNTFLSQIFYSIAASVGNLNVTESSDKKYFIFRTINFANFWVYGFFSVVLWNLINPFITLWLGQQYVLHKFVVFAVLLNFYTSGMQNAATTFRETCGLFIKGKYVPVAAAIINIAISIILAQGMGIAGVLLGTVVSRLCTYFWYDPYVSFKNVFNKPVLAYFVRYIWFAILVVISAVVTGIFTGTLQNNTFFNIALRVVICVVTPNVIFFVMFRKSSEFKYLQSIVIRFIKNQQAKLVVEKSYHV